MTNVMTRQRRWQIAQKAQRHCVICGGPLHSRNYCLRHDAAQSARSTRYYHTHSRDPLAVIAHNMVSRALKTGALLRPKYCYRCGRADAKLNAHHVDYTRPLLVTWPCYKCHRELEK